MATKPSLQAQKRRAHKQADTQYAKDQKTVNQQSKQLIAQIQAEAKKVQAEMKQQYAKRKKQIDTAKTAVEVRKQKTESFIRQHPLFSAAAAVTAGYILGRLLKRGRKK